MFKIFFGGGQAVKNDQKFIYSNITMHIALKWDGIRFGTLPTPKQRQKRCFPTGL